MKRKPLQKTNAMRELENHGVAYSVYEYEVGKTPPTGVEASARMGVSVDEVYKTLVTRGKSGTFHVFVIPVALELDLKKAASAAGEKNIEMIPQRELFGRTGYVHGGCSPLGMKKQFPTILDEHAAGLESFLVSAGRLGCSVRVSPNELAKVLDASFADVTV